MRRHTALENRKAINWAEAVQQAEEEVLGTDEVETELETALDAPSAGAGSVSIKRADFQYGSVGGGTNSHGRLGPQNPGSPNMHQAVAAQGLAGARRQIGNGVEVGRARAASIIRNLGNAKRD